MKTKVFSMFLLLIICIGTLFASDTQVDGIWYNFNSSTLTAEVTFRGSAYDRSNLNAYTGAVTIPTSVTYSNKTYRVTSIGDHAFYSCTSLASIIIPNSVTSIGDYAFYRCTSLASIIIPNSVTSIGDYAFFVCKGLISISIGNGITTIAEGTFLNCISLTSVNIPNSVTSIGDRAFDGCTGLTSVTIPNSVTSIGGLTFDGCTGLTSIEIPNSIINIGKYAYAGCTGLTSISIPNSVKSIGERAFSCCCNLTSIVVESSNTTYDSRNSCNAIIETETNTLIVGCMNTTIPNSVTSIGDYAFYGTGLKTLTISNSVTSIRSYAFLFCTSLTSITCLATIPPVLSAGAFTNVDCSKISLYVPKESLEAYQNADGWKNFNPILPISSEGMDMDRIGDSVTKIQRDGQIFILRGEKVYTLQGQEVR